MLIILRGNSGSGKTTTTYLLREALIERGYARPVAVVEQDYVRRKIFKEKEADDNRNIALIKNIVTYSLESGCDVILEGILNSKRYSSMLKSLADYEPNHHFYYFDTSFEETLRRHQTKPNKHEFGEAEMREWYEQRDLLGFDQESLIDEQLTQEQVVDKIITESFG